MHGFRSHGAGRWTSPLMAPSTTPREQSKRTASRPPSTAWREAPRTEAAAQNPKNSSGEVCEEWKACLAAARFLATEEDSRAWRCGWWWIRGRREKKVARGRIGMEMGACMDVAGLGWSDGSFVWPCMAMQAWVWRWVRGSEGGHACMLLMRWVRKESQAVGNGWWRVVREGSEDGKVLMMGMVEWL